MKPVGQLLAAVAALVALVTVAETCAWLAAHPVQRGLVVSTLALVGIAVAIFRFGRSRA